jgi:hypothetical protein
MPAAQERRGSSSVPIFANPRQQFASYDIELLEPRMSQTLPSILSRRDVRFQKVGGEAYMAEITMHFRPAATGQERPVCSRPFSVETSKSAELLLIFGINDSRNQNRTNHFCA